MVIGKTCNLVSKEELWTKNFWTLRLVLSKKLALGLTNPVSVPSS